MERKVRVLFARFILDGHERGVIVVMNRCREKGMELIYICFMDPEEVAAVAEQEDVDVIGLTSSLGAHLRLVAGIQAALKARGLQVPLIIGGVFPTVDIPELQKMGIRGFFGPGSSPEEAASFILQLARRNEI